MLRRHFNISAIEAERVFPAWEIDLLLEGLAREMGIDQGSGPSPDPFLSPPEE